MESKENILEIIEYNNEEYKEYFLTSENISDIKSLADIPKGYVRWINIDEKIEQGTLELINNTFNIHHLVYEDIRNNEQRVKVEDYDEYLYIIAKMLFFTDKDFVIEHMSFVLGKNYVISFGETKGDIFDNIRDKLKMDGTRIRKYGADFLVYSLLDAIVDGYFEVLDFIGDRIDEIEEELIKSPNIDLLNQIRETKKTLLYTSKHFWSLKEALSWMRKESSDLIRPETKPYIRDVYEHITQVLETSDMDRELLSGLADLYISNTSNRLNEVMKVLTIISTIFIPLTFIAGIYGMNFKYMPELGTKWGYPVVCMIMAILAILMIIYFKKKKWF